MRMRRRRRRARESSATADASIPVRGAADTSTFARCGRLRTGTPDPSPEGTEPSAAKVRSRERKTNPARGRQRTADGTAGLVHEAGRHDPDRNLCRTTVELRRRRMPGGPAPLTSSDRACRPCGRTSRLRDRIPCRRQDRQSCQRPSWSPLRGREPSCRPC